MLRAHGVNNILKNEDIIKIIPRRKLQIVVRIVFENEQVVLPSGGINVQPALRG